MNLAPSSTRLLIHLLAVLCIAFRLVSADDLVQEVQRADAEAINGESSTTLEDSTAESTTTDGDNSTAEMVESTTDSDGGNTTDWETTLFPGNSSCVLSNSLCVLEGSDTLCDPCESIVCGADKTCLADNSTCTTQCECADESKVENKEGVCVDPCSPSPCKNAQPCNLNSTLPAKFSCDCSEDYDGEYCENVHNFCKEAQPAKCPSGAFECVFIGVGKYTCDCASGHTKDEKANTCTKVTQRLTVDLIFKDTYYGEAYNVEGTKERKTALDAIGGAMTELYGPLLISIAYDNFTQGSLVAHYRMDMRMAANGNPQQNTFDLMKYMTNCETDNAAKKACFGDLGKPHLPINGTDTEDLRCSDVFCPEGTECVPIEQSEKSVSCSCKSGYTLIKTVVEDTGRPVDVCEDIDECLDAKSCKPGEMCINSPGSFSCVGNPCDKTPCPGNAVCKAVDHYAYDCECDWIYIASDCGTPWPLILVIVSSVLLALLILAIIGLIILFSRSRKGSSVIASTSF